MHVYWSEQREEDVPAGNNWLSDREVSCLAGLRFVKRRTDWRLGRWTAKHAVATFLNLPPETDSLAQIEIVAASSGAPQVVFRKQAAEVSISLSHCAGVALCAVAQGGVDLGCDLETIEPRSDAFIADYFTPTEQSLIVKVSTSERPLVVNLLWSAKESALKALQVGLRSDTRSVEVRPVDQPVSLGDRWSSLAVGHSDSRTFYGWWRKKDRMVRTIVASVPIDCPISPAPNNASQFAATSR